MTTTNEVDLVVKYADHKGGGDDGQLIIDDVELNEGRDNRIRHGIGNDDPQNIERGNKTYTFSTTTMMSEKAAAALRRIENGDAETDTIYVEEAGSWKGVSDGMVFNTLNVSSSDGGDTTMSIDADLIGLDLEIQSEL